MRWLWIDRAGAPAREICAKNFTQQSIYLLTGGDLKDAPFERYINSQQTALPDRRRLDGLARRVAQASIFPPCQTAARAPLSSR